MDAMRSPGGYRFLPVDGPFSGGVAAEPGHQIVRVLPPRHTPLEDGFRMVETVLERAQRPIAALCAMELRIPRPLTRQGFAEFNRDYVAQHERWGLSVEGRMPAARTNVAPELEPPEEPCLHAFCYTEEAAEARTTFVVSGVPEPPGTEVGLASCWAAIVEIVDRRMTSLEVSWGDATETQFYGTRADHEVFSDAGLPRLDELVRPGLRWFFSRPPIDDLRLEIDVRALAREYRL